MSFLDLSLGISKIYSPKPKKRNNIVRITFELNNLVSDLN